MPEFAELDARGVFLEVVKRAVPRGREQTLDDIGHLAAFLASDAARNITGQWGNARRPMRLLTSWKERH